MPLQKLNAVCKNIKRIMNHKGYGQVANIYADDNGTCTWIMYVCVAISILASIICFISSAWMPPVVFIEKNIVTGAAQIILVIFMGIFIVVNIIVSVLQVMIKLRLELAAIFAVVIAAVLLANSQTLRVA